MTDFRVEVPRTPDVTLSPNYREHPRKKPDNGGMSKIEARRVLRRAAYLATYGRLNRQPWTVPPGRLNLELFVFWERGRIPENREMPDDDNLIASCKPLIDGIADALHIDDKRFKFRGVEQDRHPDGTTTGCVIAIISTD